MCYSLFSFKVLKLFTYLIIKKAPRSKYFMKLDHFTKFGCHLCESITSNRCLA